MNDGKNISIKNKRATYDYEMLDTYVAGIVLSGTEIKSLRLGKASLTDCYCYFTDHELFVRGMNISEYHWGSYNNHMPKRDRKLLLQRRELAKLERALQDKGLTIVGLSFYQRQRWQNCRSAWDAVERVTTSGSTRRKTLVGVGARIPEVIVNG